MTYPIRAEAGTDVASLVLFDPGALPDDFDRRVAGGLMLSEPLPPELADKMVFMPTGADGAYLLHLYVGQPIPSSSAQYIREGESISIERLFVPTGRLVFCGAEYSYRDDDSRLRRDSSKAP